MYDEYKNIIQYYIDITQENVIRYNKDLFFYNSQNNNIRHSI